MNTTAVSSCRIPSRHENTIRRASGTVLGWLALLLSIALASGCATTNSGGIAAELPRESQSQTLRPGDILKISFQRTPTLDTTQQIRRDGKINLYLVGEVTAAGLTPAELEKQLLELYASQIVSKEVRVTVESSAFAVFVTGAVLRPGKLTPERTITAFEAIMEAGGFDSTRANTKSVTVIRNQQGQIQHYTINLKDVLDGKSAEPFYLEAYDVVYVPERFSWF